MKVTTRHGGRLSLDRVTNIDQRCSINGIKPGLNTVCVGLITALPHSDSLSLSLFLIFLFFRPHTQWFMYTTQQWAALPSRHQGVE